MFTRIKEIVTFVRVEALSGVLLIIAGILAIICKNSSVAPLYDAFTHAHIDIVLGGITATLSSHLLVNDFLMAIFFLVVGLEIKREFMTGELRTKETALLPLCGALGGMILPAVVYLFFNRSDAYALKGWAIPTATDIAFSLGVISLFGRTLPFSLKVFLTALAIIDDLLAILVIAFFYTAHLSSAHLLLALAVVLILALINMQGKTKFRYFFLPGVLLYYFILHSGVHATIAGVLLAMSIPLHGRTQKSRSPLKRLEHALHPWVAYGILPLFAFFNAGIDLGVVSLDMITNRITLGCLFGLFVGKQLGVFLTAFLVTRSGIARLPEGATWGQLYGVSLLTGIGFTMSLFIGGLAFADPEIMDAMKLGVILGSLLSTIVGAIVLLLTREKC